MRPETLKVIEEALTFLEESKGNADGEEKKRIDECMFCFRKCYTEDETVEHMTKKFPSSVPEVERKFFQELITLTDQNLGEAYLKDAEDCETQRRIDMRRLNTIEETENNQCETIHLTHVMVITATDTDLPSESSLVNTMIKSIRYLNF